MSAYLVVLLNVKTTDWVADYVARVPTILRKYGGEYLAVSKTISRKEGERVVPDQIALFTFPSLEKIDEFLTCEEYEPYKDARIAGSSADIFAFST
jgi:uncharacterized protein (DUF1330 family)